MSRSLPTSRPRERVLFEEKPEVDLGLLYAVTVMLVFDDIVMTLLLINLGAPELMVTIILVINAVLFALIFSYAHLRRVTLTDRRVVVRFGISRTSIPISSIRSFTD